MSFTSPFTGQVIQPTDVSYRSITLTSTLQLEWPINGTATDDAAARIMEVSTTNTAYYLEMPPANQASVGQDALIRNTGSITLTVKSYGGASTIVTVSPGQAQYIYITANPTTTGTWGIIAFGAGSSNTDAATLAGYGLLAVSSTLNTAYPVQTFGTSYTALTSDRASSYVWTSGAGTLTLSSVSTLGNNWFMLLRNGGSGTLTVSPTGGDLINGASTIALQPSDSCIISCSGTAFYTIGLGQNTQFNFSQLTKAVTSGTYTLTASEASNTIQKYTGTLTGNVTIVVPQTIQVYYITNQTNGGGSGYTVSFTTNVAGGSVASVTASAQAILLCDSVNLLNAATVAAGSSSFSLNNGSAGSPSLNFASETSTGIYRPGSGEFGITVLGTKLAGFTATGLAVTGSGNFTTGISGGTF